ncbi:MAG: hypothetical protein AB1410_04160 [Acidobacteriota bacterium]
MRSKNFISLTGIFVIILIITLPVPNKLFAHCDTMDGPVVKAAKKALETGIERFNKA